MGPIILIIIIYYFLPPSVLLQVTQVEIFQLEEELLFSYFLSHIDLCG